jgi:hypothetical protein
MVGGQRHSSRRLPRCGLAFASCGVSFQHADSPVELACNGKPGFKSFLSWTCEGSGERLSISEGRS